MKTAIGLGANMTERVASLRRAFSFLSQELLSNAVCSSLYESKPWGYLDQPDFINAVAVGDTDMSPPDILSRLKNMEGRLGRQPTFRHGPRIIDLDLLAWGEEIWNEESLTVPHPGICVRDFVLLPLLEVWPEWRHPVEGVTPIELLNRIQTKPFSSIVVAPPPLSTEIR